MKCIIQGRIRCKNSKTVEEFCTEYNIGSMKLDDDLYYISCYDTDFEKIGAFFYDLIHKFYDVDVGYIIANAEWVAKDGKVYEIKRVMGDTIVPKVYGDNKK